MWYILNASNEVIGSADSQPDDADLATRAESSISDVDPSVVMNSVWNGTSFDAPAAPVVTLTSAITAKTVELNTTRQQKIAVGLGTTVTNLVNHEAHLFRITSAAQDAITNPTIWQGKTLNGEVLGNTDALVTSSANAILATQRANSDAMEVIIGEYNTNIATVTAATTVAEVDAVVWV